ncbi:MAG: hypothetical protein AAGJ56_05595 [Myxococcota bacterium]
MRHRYLTGSGHATILIISLFAFTCADNASVPADSVSEGPGAETFVEALQSVVDNADPPATGEQTFYTTRFNEDFEVFYLFWREARRVWILDSRNETLEHWRSLRYPRGGTMLDLDEDVVATDEDVGTSTYLISRPWVADLLYDAVLHGERFIITPNAEEPKP